MPMARSAGGPAGGGAAPSPHASPISLSQGGGGIPSFFPAPKAGGGGSQSGFAPGSTAPMASNSRGGGGGFAGNPMPKAQMGGGPTSLGGGGGPSGGAPAPIRAAGGGAPGGSSGGPAIAVAPSIPRASGGGAGSPAGGGGGEGARGNPDANNNPNGRPSLDAQKDVDFGPYMADLQRRIKRAWFPPKGQESRRVVVIFKIHSDGSLSHLRLDHTSGMAIADNAALKAVENAAPFRPLPAGAPTDVDIQFTFDYNVFGGGGRGTFRQF